MYKIIVSLLIESCTSELIFSAKQILKRQPYLKVELILFKTESLTISF